jgi:prephenate dehydratase
MRNDESMAPDAALPTVSFQGEPGAFSEEAVLALFGGRAQPVPRRDFAGVAAAVASGETAYGLLPIENSVAGSVVGSYDVLASSDLSVVGEVIRPIRHCLLGVRGASLDEVARVLSHPVALAQCGRFLMGHPAMEPVATYDTAGAAMQVATAGLATTAAIAARGAGERYGLDILVEDIQDRMDNQTRFLLVTKPGGAAPVARRDGGMRSALLLETANRPGALLAVLQPFAAHGINLSKLESRPGGDPWTYRFFLEVDTAVDGDDARAAIEEAGHAAETLRVLGSFPRWRDDARAG